MLLHAPEESRKAIEHYLQADNDNIRRYYLGNRLNNQQPATCLNVPYEILSLRRDFLKFQH